MPNIVEQALNENELYLKSSSGSEVTVTKAGILAYQNTLAGSDEAVTKTRVVSHFCDVISAALGAENVASDQIELDYDYATGRPTSLSIFG
jgi:hypothetical protein